MRMRNLVAFILLFFCCVSAMAQHRGDSIDCSDRIGYSWMKGYGNANSEYVSDVAVDNDANIYVTGTFAGTLSVDGQTITSAGSTDFYVMKMTPDGTVVWLKSGGSSAVEQASAIALDANANVYVVGLSNDNTSFDGNVFPSRGSKDGFLLKLNTDGDFQYVRTLGSYLDDNALDVAVDASNNVIVTGFFNTMFQIGPTSFFQNGRGSDDSFLVKFDASGDVLWSMTYASSLQDYGRRIACDASNNVYIAGEFKGTLAFGGNSLQATNDRDVYLAKLNSSGSAQWAVQLGTTGNDSVRSLAVSSAGTIYMAYKQETGNPIVAKYSTSGVDAGTVTFTGSGNVVLNDILCDTYGNVYYAGNFTGSVDFGEGPVTSSGSGSDYFIVRYGSDDAVNMHIYGNQSSQNSLNALALDYANNVVAGGSFSSSITFGSDTETSNGLQDALLIKFERYMTFGIVSELSTNCDASNMGLNVEIVGGEAPYLYYWSNGSHAESLSGVAAGSYTLTVVDNNHCYITNSFTLSAPQPPAISLPAVSTLCPFDTVTLSIDEGMASYEWNTGATESSIRVHDAGTYSVVVTALNSCSASASISITKYPNLDVLPETDYYFCPGEALTINATGFISYYWSNGMSTPTFSTPLEYTFWVRAYNGICYYYDTITTHKYPAPSIELGGDMVYCEGDSVMVTAPDGYVAYSWSNGAEGRSVWVKTEGVLQVEATDANTCKAIDSINIEERETPDVDLGPDTTYCTDGKVIIRSQLSYQNCSFLWSTTETDENVVVTESGSYWLRVTNEYGCSGADTVNVHIIRVAPIGLPDVLDYCDDYVTLAPVNSFESYQWSTGETTATIDVNYSEVFSVTVTDINGCTISDEVYAVKHNIVEPFFGNDTVFCGLESRRLHLNTTYTSYSWNNGSTNPFIDVANPGGYYSVSVTNENGCTASTSMNASFTDNYPEIKKITSGKGLVVVEVEGGVPPYYYSADGKTWQTSNIFDNLPSDFYDIMVQDNNYCIDQMQTFLDASVGIPSFFTPNGDGFNDTWIITGLYMYPDANVSVYDRFGKQVFSSKGAVCEWDGLYGGYKLPSDSYWYVVYLGSDFPALKGSVTIKR